MGNNQQDNTKPIHKVTLADYYMAKYPITQAQYKAIMQYNPSCSKDDSCPVETVNWDDAVEFCDRLTNLLNNQQHLPIGEAIQCCLPTEAQWEYAARGGQKSRGYLLCWQQQASHCRVVPQKHWRLHTLHRH